MMGFGYEGTIANYYKYLLVILDIFLPQSCTVFRLKKTAAESIGCRF